MNNKGNIFDLKDELVEMWVDLEAKVLFLKIKILVNIGVI